MHQQIYQHLLQAGPLLPTCFTHEGFVKESFSLQEVKLHHQVKLKGSTSVSISMHVVVTVEAQPRLVLEPALMVSTACIEQRQLVRGRLTRK
jgi:hypothetical protein